MSIGITAIRECEAASGRWLRPHVADFDFMAHEIEMVIVSMGGTMAMPMDWMLIMLAFGDDGKERAVRRMEGTARETSNK